MDFTWIYIPYMDFTRNETWPVTLPENENGNNNKEITEETTENNLGENENEVETTDAPMVCKFTLSNNAVETVSKYYLN